MRISRQNFGTPKGAFRARKTLQKFGYIVLRQKRDFFDSTPPPE